MSRNPLDVLGGATRWLVVAAGAVALGVPAGTVRAQVPEGRALVESLELRSEPFDAPEVGRRSIDGIPVLELSSHELPLVTVHAYFKGGYGLFGRERYAASMGLPTLLRYGGTVALPPDSLDAELEHLAIQTSFGSAGGSVTSSVNTLTEHLPRALELWATMLTRPRFDAAEIEVWRGRQLESALRLRDDPGRLAFSRFNTLLFGDHPIGWELEEEDLTPERVTPERFAEVHARIVCRDNLILGVTGDVAWEDAEELLEGFVTLVPPCAEELPEPPTPEIRRGRGVFVLERDLEQAVIVMAHATDVHLADDPEYFSAMMGNTILGAGGFSGRLLSRVRTERGYAYGATSVWTTPRENDGILGAITRTSPENAISAIELILETMEELRSQPPTAEELATSVDQLVNGFVFNFATPDQILSRAMIYRAQELPDDWLERYLAGVQKVTPGSIRDVFADHLRPDEMTILVVGDPDRIGREALERFGPVTVLSEERDPPH